MKKTLRRLLGHNYLVIIGLCSLALVFSTRYFLLQPADPYTPIVEWNEPALLPVVMEVEPFRIDPQLEREMVDKTAATIKAMDSELTALLERKDYGLLRHELLTRAARAVSEGDKDSLGEVLSLLGQLSIEEQDLDSAEVYLMESLDVYETLGDDVGVAGVHMQLGRLHLKSRQLARTAGEAYDKLLVARWQLSHNDLSAAEQNFKDVIEETLAVNRYGTAASAYYSLVRLYTRNNNTFEAQRAATEASRLYAASGQLQRARAALEQLREAGVENWRMYEIEQEIERSFAEFERSVQQIERARDYRQLYNHYRSQGDQDRAWKLRLQASRSLKNVSKRAMYHRQPDALALLYVSNEDMGRAKDYFETAKQAFDEAGLEGLSSQTEKLRGQIF